LNIKKRNDLIDDMISELIKMKECEGNYNLSPPFSLGEIKLGDCNFFKHYTSLLSLTKKQYSNLDEGDIPLYTAQKYPVKYIKELPNRKPLYCSKETPHFSIASDGDGTAGKNLIYHYKPYYLNTSRISFEIVNNDLNIFYVINKLSDIKKVYGFDYSVKANLANLSMVNIEIPFDEYGKIDKIFQEEYITKGYNDNVIKIESIYHELLFNFIK